MRLVSVCMLAMACGTPLEPLPEVADLASPAVPVGVRTVTRGEMKLEIWYPARENTDGETASVDFAEFLSDEFFDRLGAGITIDQVPTDAVRDAEVRRGESPWPVLVFSHGFAGNRLQSTDITVHLASRGYVVVAPEHWGRHTSDILPCLFDPPLEGCDLAGFGDDDPAPDQIGDALDWLGRAVEDPDDPLFEAVDLDRMGLFGHSAGGATTAALGDVDDRFDALMPMAGSGVVSRDVPTMNLVATCDGVVTEDGIRQSHDASTDARWVGVLGGGHHAFSDICLLGLADLARENLAGREDVNNTLLNGMLTLVADGCPGETPTVEGCDTFLDLEDGFEAARWYATEWFDSALGETPTLTSDLYEFVEVEP